MRTLFDTSVLFAALDVSHEFHQRAVVWLQMAQQKEIHGIISTHSLAELYAKLSGIPLYPRISPSLALEIISNSILPAFEIIFLDTDDYVAAVERTARLGISGGAIYDALIAHAAAKGNAEQIVTFNERHFIRVSAGLPFQIVVP